MEPKLNSKCHTGKKQDTIPKVKHGGGSIMLWGFYSAAGTGKVVGIGGKFKGAEHREILMKS